MLPRGLKIEEEEQSTLRKDTDPSFFSNYKREWSIKLFLDPEVKFIRSHQSYQRKLKTRTLNQLHAIPKELRTCMELEFVVNVARDKMAIYDSTKDQKNRHLGFWGF